MPVKSSSREIASVSGRLCRTIIEIDMYTSGRICRSAIDMATGRVCRTAIDMTSGRICRTADMGAGRVCRTAADIGAALSPEDEIELAALRA